jgi:hypothetical protein
MGGLDWYGRGAEALLHTQSADGSWNGFILGLDADPKKAESGARVRRIVGTCFALLFLRKGTTPVHRGAVTQTGGVSDINFDEARKATGRDLEDVLDLVLMRWSTSEDSRMRRRLLDGVTWIGPKIVEPVLSRLASAGPQNVAANALLLRATGLDFGWTRNARQPDRDLALERWRAWWLGAKDHLVYDSATRRLVVR